MKKYKIALEKEIDYSILRENYIQTYALGLKGQKYSKIKDLANEFISNNLELLHQETISIVNLFSDYLKIVITGEPEELMIPLQKILGFDKIHCTILEADSSDILTGKMVQNNGLKEGKLKAVHEILRDNEIDLEKSYAFGDTPHDLPLLEKVSHPFVLDGNPDMVRIAKAKGWTIASHETVLDVLKADNGIK